MIKRTLRGLIQLLGGLGAGLVIAMSLAAWRLSSGPISLSFLTPHFERILSEAHPDIRVRLDDTVLTWGGWQRALDIRVVNARAIDPLETVLARVPELSLSLSAAALARGVAAPKRVELLRPTLRLVRLKDGRLQVSLGEEPPSDGSRDQGDNLTRMLARLTEEPRPDQPLSYLSRIDVRDADLTLDDYLLGVSWRAPAAQLHLRRDEKGLRGELAVDLNIDGAKARLTLLGDYATQTRLLHLGAEFEGLRPALFARLAPALGPLATLDLPMRGNASLSLGEKGVIDAIGFEVAGGGGHFTLPAPFAQRVAVREARVKGRAGGPDDSLVIDDLSIAFEEGAKVLLPPPTNHEMPIRGLHAVGRFAGQPGTAEISLLDVDLAGPRLSVMGGAAGIGSPEGTTVQAHAVLAGTKTNELHRYWPKAWGADAHGWVMSHLSDGWVPRAETDIALRVGADGKTTLLSLTGDMDIEGVTVDYLPPMPKAHKAKGRAVFNPNRFDITLTGGEVRDLVLRKGKVFLFGLSERDQFADIELFIDGPVRNALDLIDHKPLGFASTLGIKPSSAEGTASARVKLDFILEKTLGFDRVDVAAEASIKDLKLANVVMGQAVTDGQLELKVDKQGMDVKGPISLAGVPAKLAWRRNFGDKEAVVSHYDLQGRLPDVRKTEDLGLDLGPFAGDYLRGAADLTLQFTQFKGGRGRIKAAGDLRDLAMALPAIGWYKSKGVAGGAEISLALQGDNVTEIENFAVSAGDLQVAGAARYSQAGTGLDKLEFRRIAYGNGRTDLRGTLEPGADGGWRVSLSGPSFDASPLFDQAPPDQGKAGDAKQPWDSLALALDLRLDNVWLSRERKLKKVKGNLARVQELWRKVNLDGEDDGGAPFRIRIAPQDGGRRSLAVHSDDAGAFLRALDYYGSVTGGILDLNGTFDDTKAGSPLSANLEIKDYRIRQAPLLAHVVSLAAITGILDGLQGEGIGFIKLEAPFVYHDGVIELGETKSSGLSLGFTASGRIYTGGGAMDLQGTIVPAYAINTFWGEVPILGKLLTGGEKGGGVFAAKYRITGAADKPDVTVNPLSALTPGFLRNLFDIFETANDKEGAQAPVKPSPAPVKQAPVGGL